MSIYMRSCDYEMWEVVMDGPYVPTKTKEESEELEPKLRCEWTDVDTEKVQLNFKAMNTFVTSLTLAKCGKQKFNDFDGQNGNFVSRMNLNFYEKYFVMEISWGQGLN